MRGPGERSPSQRQLRVGEELRHALAAILKRDEVRDPDLQDVPVTVTEVRISPDLRQATAYVMPLGGGEVETVVAALNRARPFLRWRIARAVKLKYAPDIAFSADPSFDSSARIEELLRDPLVARDLAPGGDDEDPGHGA